LDGLQHLFGCSTSHWLPSPIFLPQCFPNHTDLQLLQLPVASNSRSDALLPLATSAPADSSWDQPKKYQPNMVTVIHNVSSLLSNFFLLPFLKYKGKKTI